MTFLQQVDVYLTKKGYEYLGVESGLIFFKDKNGRVWGSSESAIAKNMK